MKYLNITYPDVNNGSGCRVTLWVAGCPHHCKGCHNPESWDFNSGKEFTIKEWDIIKNILNKSYISGLTISGGEPLMNQNIDELIKFIKYIKDINKSIWIYTGFEYKNLSEHQKSILQYIDVLVDGPYIQEQRDVSLPFRGSSNQNIIYTNGNIHRT